jgi:hypothetical protein
MASARKLLKVQRNKRLYVEEGSWGNMCIALDAGRQGLVFSCLK